jgi:hypothetical protein
MIFLLSQLVPVCDFGQAGTGTWRKNTLFGLILKRHTCSFWPIPVPEPVRYKVFCSVTDIVGDPDPVGSGPFCRIQIRKF